MREADGWLAEGARARLAEVALRRLGLAEAPALDESRAARQLAAEWWAETLTLRMRSCKFQPDVSVDGEEQDSWTPPSDAPDVALVGFDCEDGACDVRMCHEAFRLPSADARLETLRAVSQQYVLLQLTVWLLEDDAMPPVDQEAAKVQCVWHEVCVAVDRRVVEARLQGAEPPPRDACWPPVVLEATAYESATYGADAPRSRGWARGARPPALAALGERVSSKRAPHAEPQGYVYAYLGFVGSELGATGAPMEMLFLDAEGRMGVPFLDVLEGAPGVQWAAGPVVTDALQAALQQYSRHLPPAQRVEAPTTALPPAPRGKLAYARPHDLTEAQCETLAGFTVAPLELHRGLYTLELSR